ncbi:ankyrin repeat-containing domain protein [Trichophaea hybrida]|nr:ankyrin repeat-containing domain protein [Trichophaea hybrida]
MLRLFIDSGADLNITDQDDKTAAHWAAEGAHEDIFKLLLDRGGVDLRAADIEGRTALHWAAKGRYERIARLLAENETAIHLATE